MSCGQLTNGQLSLATLYVGGQKITAATAGGVTQITGDAAGSVAASGAIAVSVSASPQTGVLTTASTMVLPPAGSGSGGIPQPTAYDVAFPTAAPGGAGLVPTTTGSTANPLVWGSALVNPVPQGAGLGFADGSTPAKTVSISAPAAVGTSYTVKLPADAPNLGTVLSAGTTNASDLEWKAVSGGGSTIDISGGGLTGTITATGIVLGTNLTGVNASNVVTINASGGSGGGIPNLTTTPATVDTGAVAVDFSTEVTTTAGAATAVWTGSAGAMKLALNVPPAPAPTTGYDYLIFFPAQNNNWVSNANYPLGAVVIDTASTPANQTYAATSAVAAGGDPPHTNTGSWSLLADVGSGGSGGGIPQPTGYTIGFSSTAPTDVGQVPVSGTSGDTSALTWATVVTNPVLNNSPILFSTDESSTDYVGLRGPTTVTTSYVIELPPAAGAIGDVLTIGAGSGTSSVIASWAPASGGSNSVLGAGIVSVTGTSASVTLGSGVVAKLAALGAGVKVPVLLTLGSASAIASVLTAPPLDNSSVAVQIAASAALTATDVSWMIVAPDNA